MKKLFPYHLCVTSTMVILPIQSHAQKFTATAQNLTFALIETRQDPALPKKDTAGKVIKGGGFVVNNAFTVDTFKNGNIVKEVITNETGVKFTSFKISNKEILEALRLVGRIDNITGYSIVYIRTGDNEVASFSNIFLTKNGDNPVYVGDILYGFFAPTAEIIETSYKSVATSDFVNNTQSVTESFKNRKKAQFSMVFNSTILDMQFSGNLERNGAYQTLTDNTTKEKYTLFVPGSYKFSSIVGNSNFKNEVDSVLINYIEGSVSFGSGIPTFPIAP